MPALALSCPVRLPRTLSPAAGPAASASRLAAQRDVAVAMSIPAERGEGGLGGAISSHPRPRLGQEASPQGRAQEHWRTLSSLPPQTPPVTGRGTPTYSLFPGDK